MYGGITIRIVRAWLWVFEGKCAFSVLWECNYFSMCCCFAFLSLCVLDLLCKSRLLGIIKSAEAECTVHYTRTEWIMLFSEWKKKKITCTHRQENTYTEAQVLALKHTLFHIHRCKQTNFKWDGIKCKCLCLFILYYGQRTKLETRFSFSFNIRLKKFLNSWCKTGDIVYISGRQWLRRWSVWSTKRKVVSLKDVWVDVWQLSIGEISREAVKHCFTPL